MPLADHGGGVAGLAQYLRKGLLCAVKGNAVAEKAVQMTVLPGQDDRATGTANGVRDITLLEKHAFICQSIHVGRGVDLRTISANCMRRVVISEDEQNIRPLCGLE